MVTLNMDQYWKARLQPGRDQVCLIGVRGHPAVVVTGPSSAHARSASSNLRSANRTSGTSGSIATLCTFTERPSGGAWP